MKNDDAISSIAAFIIVGSLVAIIWIGGVAFTVWLYGTFAKLFGFIGP